VVRYVGLEGRSRAMPCHEQSRFVRADFGRTSHARVFLTPATSLRLTATFKDAPMNGQEKPFNASDFEERLCGEQRKRPQLAGSAAFCCQAAAKCCQKTCISALCCAFTCNDERTGEKAAEPLFMRIYLILKGWVGVDSNAQTSPSRYVDSVRKSRSKTVRCGPGELSTRVFLPA
jgi:hypothetical protein